MKPHEMDERAKPLETLESLKDFIVYLGRQRKLEHDAMKLALQGLAEALAVVLDQVDYTHGACKVVEMVGAVLPKQIIAKARAAFEAAKPFL